MRRLVITSKNVRALIFLSAAFLTLAGCAGPKPAYQFLEDKNCDAAEHYARENFRANFLTYMKGNIALCRGEKDNAVRLYSIAVARQDKWSHLAEKALSEMGEKPVKVGLKYGLDSD